MPIQFRCTKCNQLLSISRKKAGAEIVCPKCTTKIRVPEIAEAESPAVPQSAAPIARHQSPQDTEDRRSSPPVVEQKPLRERPAPDSDEGPSRTQLPAVMAPASRSFATTDEVDDDGLEPAPQRSATAVADALPWNPWTDIDHDDDEYHPTARQHPPKDELDMTSLVDVTFLLLVFFMITASFTVQKFIQIAAPEADDNAAAATAVVSADDIVGESVVVAVDAQDRIQVDDAPVASLSDLKQLLENKLRDEQKTDVLIEAAYQATHGTVVAVTDMAIQAGMRHVRRASRRDADE